jgi:hypothetical protein
MLDYCHIQNDIHLVIATGLSNKPMVRILTGGSVRFGFRPGQKPNPYLSWQVVTQPGHRTAGIGLVWNRTAV